VAAPKASVSHLTRVKPEARALIAGLNPIFRSVFDKEIRPGENKFWADYIHSGEVQDKVGLVDKMEQAKNSGKNPRKTCRNCDIDTDQLKNKWFPYLFYYTWGSGPSGDEKTYWHSRIDGGRNTIQKLDSNIQWLKQNEDKRSK